jgi:hypothetical protein
MLIEELLKQDSSSNSVKGGMRNSDVCEAYQTLMIFREESTQEASFAGECYT